MLSLFQQIKTIILLIFFFLSSFSFSFSKIPAIEIGATPDVKEVLKTKLSGLPKIVGGLASIKQPCYKIKTGCEKYWEKEGGYSSNYQFSNEERDCLFNGCLSWEPSPLTIWLTGEEINSLLEKFLPSEAPFENPRILLSNDKFVATVNIKKPLSGTLYAEGVLKRQDEFSIKISFIKAQFNNFPLEGAMLNFVETNINNYINEQLRSLSGVRIDELKIIDSKLHFVGMFPNLWDSDQNNFVMGELLVGFHNDVTEQNAQSLIESYGLIWESRFSKTPSEYAARYGVVKVPRGEENKWLKIFKKEKIVRYVELNAVYGAD